MKTALMSLVAVAVAGVPGVASAATVSVDSTGTAVYRAAPREANGLKLVNAFGPLGFTDRGAPLYAGAGCTAGPAVTCDATDISAALGDRADSALVNSFLGDAALDAGPGDDDVLVGAASHASALGGAGDDSIVAVSNGLGTVSGGAGNDAIAGRSGSDDLAGDEGADLLAEQPGHSIATLDGGDGADRLVGSAFSELFGGAGNDLLVEGYTLDGGAGGDRIKSLGGATVRGGAGNDTIDAADATGAADTITCGSGFDVVWTDVEDTVAGDCELRLSVPAPALPGLAVAQADATALLAHVPNL